MQPFESYNWEGLTYPQSYCRSLFDYARAFPFQHGMEVGFDQGASALAFLRACPEGRIFSLDINLCGPGNARLRTSEVSDRFSFRCGDSREVLPVLPYDKAGFDMIYIDGDHLYDAARLDLFNAEQWLAPGGYMIVDDADPSHAHFGVGKAVDEFCNERGFYKVPLAGSTSDAVVLRKQP